MSYFPKIYPNEYLYSVILRYDRHSGNNDLAKSFEDLFGNISRIGKNREKLYCFDSKFKNSIDINIKTLLVENTNLVLFIPFNKKVVIGSSIDYLFKFLYPPRIKPYILKLENSLPLIPYLKYCVQCYKDDINIYGEGYYHLDHQYEGNYFCKKHNRLLKISIPIKSNRSLPSFDFNDKYSIDLCLKSDKQYIELAKLSLDIQLLANNPSFYIDIFTKMETYKDILIRKGYGYKHSKNIKQEKLCTDFIRFYTTESLQLLDIYPKKENSDNWIKRITRNQIYTYISDLTPIHHLIFIRFFKNIKKDGRYKKVEKKLYKVIS